MSASELPEDLSRWPADAYQLLGVERGVGPRDLRRAYTRLIRIYKPEQYPEHFRRIREAYENILRHAELFGFLHSQSGPPSDETPAADPPAADVGSDAPQPDAPDVPGDSTAVTLPPLLHGLFPPTEAPEILPPPREWQKIDMPAPNRHARSPGPRLNELQELWQRACAGEEATAYHHLVELDEVEPGRTDICLPLYWLLALTPALDPQRSPCDWLVRGLQHRGIHGPLRELYRREIVDDPAEGLSDRCSRLLALEAPAGAVADLAEWRWQAAGRLGRSAIIGHDLEALRPRILHEDEEIWLRLLISAAEQLLAIADPEALPWRRQCLEELRRLEHLHARAADALDRLEFLVDVAKGLTSPPVPPIFRQLLSFSWSRPFPEVRPLLWTFLEQAARDPDQTLKLFDRMQPVASAAVAHFGSLLLIHQGSLAEPPDDPRGGNELADLVGDFLSGQRHAGYPEFRRELFRFCLREAISPETVAEVAAANGDAALSQMLTADGPLRYVWLAHHLFWA
jgi:hypothetical protein